MQTLYHLALHPYVMHVKALWCVKRDSLSYLASDRQKMEQEANFRVTKYAQSCTDTRFFQNHRQLLRRNCRPLHESSETWHHQQNAQHNHKSITYVHSHLKHAPSPLIYGSAIPEWSKLVQFVSYQTYHSLEILVILCLMLTRYRAQGFCWRTGHAPATRARASNLEPILEPTQKEEGVLFFEGFGICVL